MKYAAFFKGINVGGRHIVRMPELKRLLENLGFQNVVTYIQSGNAVFEAEQGPDAAASAIRRAFANAFDFVSPVVLRSLDEMKELIERLPFSEAEIAEAEAADPEVEHLYVYLLDGPPAPRGLSQAEDGDMLRPGDRAWYLLCRGSVRDSRLAGALGKLPVATARNWKTLLKVYALMGRN